MTVHDRIEEAYRRGCHQTAVYIMRGLVNAAVPPRHQLRFIELFREHLKEVRFEEKSMDCPHLLDTVLGATIEQYRVETADKDQPL